MADDAVHRKPVSAPNSLLTGKNTEKFEMRPLAAAVFVTKCPTLGHF